jgi:D-tyrosyl-tRNA(Tyr) deacylase
MCSRKKMRISLWLDQRARGPYANNSTAMVTRMVDGAKAPAAVVVAVGAVALHGVVPVLSQNCPTVHAAALLAPMQIDIVAVAATPWAKCFVLSRHSASAPVPLTTVEVPHGFATVSSAVQVATRRPKAAVAVLTENSLVPAAASREASVFAAVTVTIALLEPQYIVIALQSVVVPVPAHRQAGVPQIWL